MPENGLNENNLEHGSGKAWVKDGKIFVKNPSGDEKAPTITPGHGVNLFVNGDKVVESTSVSEKDEIVIEPVIEEEPGTYTVNVSKDGLSAVLEIKTGTVSRYFLRDCEPERELILKTGKTVEKPCPFKLDEIMKVLAGKNISYGIKQNEIQAILSQPEDGSYVIAQGDPPGDTIDDRIELNFATGPEEQKSFTESDTVNFRDKYEIPSVDPGALLAVKHPGVEGAPGKKVTGDIVPPAKLQVFDLTGGKGVELSPDNTKAFASIGGRPVVKKSGNRYIIEVEPVLHKKGDVDISSGNIRFKGDIVIHGNVSEGMTIQAAGTIEIKGMVFESRIATQTHITVGQNITGSSLVAGGNNTFFKTLYKILESLHADLSEIAKAIPSLAQHPKLKGVRAGQLIQFLIDKKYTRVPGTIAEMTKLSGQNSFILPSDMDLLLGNVEKNLKGLNLLKIDSVVTFHKLISEIEEAQVVLEGMAKDKANIAFAYSINSKIEASGDVNVGGRGCINTNIRAGGSVNIKGVFRGGEIAAGGDIILNEAGSEMGARTLIKAGDGRKVLIRKAYENVRIQVGDRRVNITSQQNNIMAELDEMGALRIRSSVKG